MAGLSVLPSLKSMLPVQYLNRYYLSLETTNVYSNISITDVLHYLIICMSFLLAMKLFFYLLNAEDIPGKPIFYSKNAAFRDLIMKTADVFQTEYIPTSFWGYSGHVQTILYSMVGRINCPVIKGRRNILNLQDGSTFSYDIFDPASETKTSDVILFLIPGICNNAESDYVQSFVKYAVGYGFRCAVLNHTGTVCEVPLTTPRIFTFGHTDVLNAAMWHVSEQYPSNKMVAFGYSMGGNLITKYAGEKDRQHPRNLIAIVSICNPYSALMAIESLFTWKSFRIVYQYALTEMLKALIRKHRQILLTEEIKRVHNISEPEIVSAYAFHDLDDAYTRKVNGFDSLHKYYEWSSSCYYLENIKLPAIFINSKDDPLVSECMLKPVKDFCTTRDNAIHIEMRHGGHLGFFEGGVMVPNNVCWLDRAMIQLANSLYAYHQQCEEKKMREEKEGVNEKEENSDCGGMEGATLETIG